MREHVQGISKGLTKVIWVAVAFAYLIAYWPVLVSLYKVWMENSNNSHGIFVPMISGYLIWRERNKLKNNTLKASYIGLIALVISLTLYIVGYAGGIEILPRLTIVTTLIALIMFNFGIDCLRVFWFPTCFLFFMIPLPVSLVNLVSFPLKILATKISAYAIGTLSIPVLREGNMLYFSNTSLEVAEACSGLRSLYAYVMLGVLFAYLTRSSVRSKVFFMLFPIPLALCMNIVRITVTGILAYVWGAKIARGFLHEFSGVLIFLVGFFIMTFLYGKLCRAKPCSSLCEAQ